MMLKKYNNIYSKQIKHTNIPLNIITKIFLTRSSPIKKNLYRINKDKYNLRKNSYFFLFKNKTEIRRYFKKFFKVIEIDLIYSDFKNLEENYYLCVMQKKN